MRRDPTRILSSPALSRSPTVEIGWIEVDKKCDERTY
jgi:hypothetical protein